MLLFLLYPDDFDRILGGTDRRKVVRAFTDKSKAEIKKLPALQLDQELAAIRRKQEEDYGTDQLDFYVPPLKEQWRDTEHKHWLFAWNPGDWTWPDVNEVISDTSQGKSVIVRWSCSNSAIKPGDKVWLVRLGAPPKGIMATGNVVSEPYDDVHWDEEKAKAGQQQSYVDIEFSLVLDVFKDPFITLDDLAGINIDKQAWSPQSSGIEIKKRSAGLLEKLWGQITTNEIKEPKSVTRKMIMEPINTILYGPPGTGKTYELNRLVEKYVTQANTVSREQWLAQELQPVRWFDVVFMALYALGGKAKVAEIERHEFVQQKAKAIGRTKNIKQQIWASLQTHTHGDSETVRYAKCQAPFFFDKDTGSSPREWGCFWSGGFLWHSKNCVGAGFIKRSPVANGRLNGHMPTGLNYVTPYIQFLFVAPQFRVELPSDPASRQRPCPSANLRLREYLVSGLSPD